VRDTCYKLRVTGGLGTVNKKPPFEGGLYL
jgi:hypothetical protein